MKSFILAEIWPSQRFLFFFYRSIYKAKYYKLLGDSNNYKQTILTIHSFICPGTLDSVAGDNPD